VSNHVPDDPRDLQQLGFKSSAAEYITERLTLDSRYRIGSPGVHLWRLRSTCLPLRMKAGDILIVDTEAVLRPGSLVVTTAGRVERWGGGEAWGVVRALVRQVDRDREEGVHGEV
jgi:hypothetical protein